jgi:hypothetical protein
VSWDQCFDRPVVVPDGKTLRTLEDARLYILALSDSEREAVAWQVAIEALLVAADVSDVEIEDHERKFDSSRKDAPMMRATDDP